MMVIRQQEKVEDLQLGARIKAEEENTVGDEGEFGGRYGRSGCRYKTFSTCNVQYDMCVDNVGQLQHFGPGNASALP